MADVQDQILAQLVENNRLLSRSSGGTGAAPSGGTSGAGATTGVFAGLNTVVVGTTNLMGKLASGTATASDALGLITTAVKQMPGIGPALGNIVDKLGTGVIDVNNTMKETGKYGVLMGQNIGEFNQAVTGARLTLPEFQEQIRKNATSISGLGSTMDKSAANYLAFTKDLQESDVANQMRLAGVSAQEVAEIGMASMANKRGVDMSDANARKEAIQATIELATQMNETSRITGKSKEAMVQELKARNENVVIAATLMQMGPEAKANYDSMQLKLAGLGDSAKDVADEIASGGVRTAEGAAKLAAMGPAAAQFEAAVKQQMAATDTASKEAAAKSMDAAKRAVTEYQQSHQFLEQVKTGVGAASDAARKQFGQNLEIASTVTKKAEADAAAKKAAAEGKAVAPSTPESRAAEQRAAVALPTGKDAPGIVDPTKPGSEVARTLNAVDKTFKDAAAGIGIQAKALNDKVSTYTGAFQTLNDTWLKRRTAEQAGEIGSEVIGAVSKYGKAPGAASAANLPKSGYTAGGDVASRADGSLGSTGKLIEDFGKGTKAMLHGKEGVITEKQLGDVIGQAKEAGGGSGLASMMDQLKGMMGKINPTASVGMPSANDMIGNLKASVSSMTTDRAADDRAKKAEWDNPTPTNVPVTPAQPPAIESSGPVNVQDEMLKELTMLNSNIKELIQHSSDAVDNSKNQVRATKSLSGNRFA